jgi:hypothetical protein
VSLLIAAGSSAEKFRFCRLPDADTRISRLLLDGVALAHADPITSVSAYWFSHSTDDEVLGGGGLIQEVLRPEV